MRMTEGSQVETDKTLPQWHQCTRFPAALPLGELGLEDRAPGVQSPALLASKALPPACLSLERKVDTCVVTTDVCT